MQWATKPTTPAGAAVALDNAWFILLEHADGSYHAMKKLRSIIRRFKRNEQRPDDLTELHAMLKWAARLACEPRDPCGSMLEEVPLLIEQALHGVAGPAAA